MTPAHGVRPDDHAGLDASVIDTVFRRAFNGEINLERLVGFPGAADAECGDVRRIAFAREAVGGKDVPIGITGDSITSIATARDSPFNP